MGYIVREITPEDDRAVENIIRSCLVEFGADHAGTAWTDPDLGCFSKVYAHRDSRYWVAQEETGEIVGGAGIGKLKGADGVCELQKMYCLPKARGTGAAGQLMRIALDFAAKHYRRCYLETLENMKAAQRFYEKYGFERTFEKIVKTDHFACDVRYIKEL